MPFGIRITKSDLHRGFVELDRFPDDKCEKFVRAAQGGFLLRSFIRLLLVLMFLVTSFAIMVGAAIWATGGTNATRASQYSVWSDIGIFLVVAIGLLVAGGATLFVRDLWLKRRIRYVLDMRGRCSKCHYGLLGLPVSDKFEVRCPECGETTDVDPSLAVLADGSGPEESRRVRQDALLDPNRKVYWTPQRRVFAARFVKRGTVAAAGIFVLLIVAAVCWEAFIRVQASRAVKMRPGVAAMQNFVESKQTVAYSSEDDAWAVLVKAIETVNGANKDFMGEEKDWPKLVTISNGTNTETEVWDAANGRMIEIGETFTIEESRRLVPEFLFILNPPKNAVAFEDAYNKAIAELGKTMIGKYEEAGLFELLRTMPSKRWTVKPVQSNGDETMIFANQAEREPALDLASVEAGRIDLSLAVGNIDRAIDAFEEQMAIQRVFGEQARMSHRYTSRLIQSVALTRLVDIAEKANVRQLARLEAIMREQQPSHSTADVLEGERISGVDAICWLFSDAKRVRFGQFSPGLDEMFGGKAHKLGRGVHLGFLNENVDALNAYYDHLKKTSSLTRLQQINQRATPPANLGFVSTAAARAGRFLFEVEHLRSQQLTAARIILAAYRFRAEKSVFPTSREELEAFVGKPFSVDAMTEVPLELLRLDPTKDAFGRSLVVYSVGPDGVDNGGVEAPRSVDGNLPAFDKTPAGTDFVFFDPAGQ